MSNTQYNCAIVGMFLLTFLSQQCLANAGFNNIGPGIVTAICILATAGIIITKIIRK